MKIFDDYIEQIRMIKDENVFGKEYTIYNLLGTVRATTKEKAIEIYKLTHPKLTKEVTETVGHSPQFSQENLVAILESVK